MTLLDNFTVHYQNENVANQQLLQTSFLEGPSFNSLDSGTFNVCLYTYEGEPPKMLISLAVFGEESLEDFFSEGVEFGKVKNFGEINFLEKRGKVAILDVTLLNDELTIFQNGPRELVCLMAYEKIRILNREQLAKLLVKEYFKRFYNYEAEYRVMIKDDSIIDV